MGNSQSACYSPVCMVLSGFTPGGVLTCSPVTCLPVEDRQPLTALLCLAV